MLKRVGVLALMLCGGAAFLCPKAALAQDYRGWYGNTPQYRYESRFYGDGERFRDEHREHKWREHENRERAWRQHERWERRWYSTPYNYAPRIYYGDPYCPR
jgi:hypothetical protein